MFHPAEFLHSSPGPNFEVFIGPLSHGIYYVLISATLIMIITIIMIIITITILIRIIITIALVITCHYQA